mmetsp:Transcript_18212/g.39858  ORF Transcript_18212/g.39858 Transcript_18212/m.39858 type:complete len:183 (+) Transcript_18212:76-624(+)
MGATICKEICGRSSKCGDALDARGLLAPSMPEPGTKVDVWRAAEIYEDSQRAVSALEVLRGPGRAMKWASCNALWKSAENIQIAVPDGEKVAEKSSSVPAEAPALEAITPERQAEVAPEQVIQAISAKTELRPLPSGGAKVPVHRVMTRSGTEVVAAWSGPPRQVRPSGGYRHMNRSVTSSW